MEIDEAKLIESLRAVMERRGVKLTEIASEIGVPYRSLQNYFGLRSSMPTPVYLQVCRLLGVTADYPVTGRFKLDTTALKEAVIDVLGPYLPLLYADGELRRSEEIPSFDAQEQRRAAGLIAMLLESRYDVIRELELTRSSDAS